METRELDTGKEKEEAEASSQTVGPSPNCLSVFSCWVCSTPPSPFFFKQVVSYQVVAAVVPTPSCWTVKVLDTGHVLPLPTQLERDKLLLVVLLKGSAQAIMAVNQLFTLLNLHQLLVLDGAAGQRRLLDGEVNMDEEMKASEPAAGCASILQTQLDVSSSSFIFVILQNAAGAMTLPKQNSLCVPSPLH
ncbi:hypothetical protein LR48_Vigan11g136200 [Vigna angularis]|uniref:Uncharacterized protein n=1 Tax=Phaseolus angularis TaxID=3914 RepID=A0A0L9VTQ3_PHAAN|nr:hypothetical protein LR48_Vigan11g136200 [Vigna angularis]